MSKKDCAFQFATSDGVVYEDTGLITRGEAEELWEQYIRVFKDFVEENKDPEMAIWTDMVDETDYYTKARHWCGEDFMIKDGDLYSVERVA